MNLKLIRFDSAFTADECNTIISSAKDFHRGIVHNDYGAGVNWKNRRCRKSGEIKLDWLTKRVRDMFTQAAEETGIETDPDDIEISVMHYKGSELGCVIRHQDVMPGGLSPVRKLSMTCVLNAGNFEGGKLGVLDTVYDLKTGDLVVFPSPFEHEVYPVTQGERYSLVAWCHGTSWPEGPIITNRTHGKTYIEYKI